MRSYIRSVVDIDTSDISDDVMNRFLGEAYDVIVYSEKRWPFFEVSTTFNTVASQKDYTTAAVGALVTNGLREIASLRTGNQVLEYIGRDDGDIIYPLDSTASGNPWYWSFWADSIRLYPTPGSILTINVRGYKDPAAFGAGVSDATEPSDLPTPFHMVLATYGIARAYEQQEDPDMAIQYLSLFNQELENLKARYDDMPAPQPVLMNRRSSSRFSRVMPARLQYSWE